jgi:hypothetical protein
MTEKPPSKILSMRLAKPAKPSRVKDPVKASNVDTSPRGAS